MSKITQEWLKQFYYYEDGELYHRETEEVCGRLSGRYLKLRLLREDHQLHRVIWFYHYGYWPERVDHRDANGFNNRIENLRDCTPAQNIANATWGLNRGIEKRGTRFRVTIWVNKQRVRLGTFDTIEEARAVFAKAADEFYGEFAETNRHD